MKIAMVSEHASPLAAVGEVDAGGQNVHVAALATALARRGHHVVVYTRRDDPALPARVAMLAGVTVQHLDAGPPRPVPKDDLLPFVPEMARALTRQLSLDPPAVVHAHFWMSGLAAVAAAPPEVPVLQTFHALGSVKARVQGAHDTSPSERLGLERGLVRRVTRVIATCTDEMRELARMGATRAAVDVVPSGVDTTAFSPVGPRARRDAAARVLVVGRLVPRKGVDDAIRAIALVPGAELIVAGGPDVRTLGTDPEGRRLRTLAGALGVRDRVHLLGGVSRGELPALIRSADVVACLPWYEPFGIVPLEAMACGVPVLGSAVGGLLDTVADGVTGRLVPPRDPARAAAALAELLAEPARRRGMGQAGVRRARERYTWARVASLTEQSYRRAGALILPAPLAAEAVG